MTYSYHQDEHFDEKEAAEKIFSDVPTEVGKKNDRLFFSSQRKNNLSIIELQKIKISQSARNITFSKIIR